MVKVRKAPPDDHELVTERVRLWRPGPPSSQDQGGRGHAPVDTRGARITPIQTGDSSSETSYPNPRGPLRRGRRSRPAGRRADVDRSGPGRASPAGAAAAPGKDKANGSHTPTHPLAIARKQAALKEAALEKRLKGDKAFQGKTAKVGRQGAEGPVRRARARGHRPGSSSCSPSSATRSTRTPTFQGPPPDGSTTDVDRSAAQRDPGARPQRRQLARCGRPTTTVPTTRTCTSTGWRSTTSRSPRAGTPSTVTSPSWVKVPFNEARYGRNYCGGIVCRDTHGS